MFRAIRPLDPATSCAASSAATARSPASRPTRRSRPSPPCGCTIDSWRWEGVPFFIRAGKCMPVTATEVLVEFKRPPLADAVARTRQLLPLPPEPRGHDRLRRQVKLPGEQMAGERRRAVARRTSPTATTWTPTNACSAMRWKATPRSSRARTPSRRRGDRRPDARAPDPVHEYEPGTWGPREADELTADIGGWHCPLPSVVHS